MVDGSCCYCQQTVPNHENSVRTAWAGGILMPWCCPGGSRIDYVQPFNNGSTVTVYCLDWSNKKVTGPGFVLFRKLHRAVGRRAMSYGDLERGPY